MRNVTICMEAAKRPDERFPHFPMILDCTMVAALEWANVIAYIIEIMAPMLPVSWSIVWLIIAMSQIETNSSPIYNCIDIAWGTDKKTNWERTDPSFNENWFFLWRCSPKILALPNIFITSCLAYLNGKQFAMHLLIWKLRAIAKVPEQIVCAFDTILLWQFRIGPIYVKVFGVLRGSFPNSISSWTMSSIS